LLVCAEIQWLFGLLFIIIIIPRYPKWQRVRRNESNWSCFQHCLWADAIWRWKHMQHPVHLTRYILFYSNLKPIRSQLSPFIIHDRRSRFQVVSTRQGIRHSWLKYCLPLSSFLSQISKASHHSGAKRNLTPKVFPLLPENFQFHTPSV
jgi:hypothetical protein